MDADCEESIYMPLRSWDYGLMKMMVMIYRSLVNNSDLLTEQINLYRYERLSPFIVVIINGAINWYEIPNSI